MFQISWSPNTLPLPNTFYPPVFVRCFVILLLLSCTFGVILLFDGLYNVSRSLCSPGGSTYVPSPSVSYFCCFVLSLICTFVVSYFLYFVVSQFRYFTLQLFHTLWFRPFRTGPLFADTYIPRCYVPRSLSSSVSMFRDPYVPRSYVTRYLDFTVLCSPVSMFPSTYVPRSLCFPVLYSPILRLHCPMFPGLYVPRSLCSPIPMFPSTYVPRAHISPNDIYFPYFILSLICTYVVSNFCYLLFRTFVVENVFFVMIVVAAIFDIIICIHNMT